MDSLAARYPAIAELVQHMTQREPDRRHSMEAYLSEWSAKVFPGSVRTLHGLLQPLMGWTKERAVLHMQACFADALHTEAAAAAQWASKATAAAHRLAEQLRLDPEAESSLGDESATQVHPQATAAATQRQYTWQRDGQSAEADPGTPRMTSDDTVGTSGSAAAPSAALQDAQQAAAERSAAEQPVSVAAKGTQWSREGANFLHQALHTERNPAALCLIASALCGLLRGASTQEGRWAVARMLFDIGAVCDSRCILEWLVPYLLHYIVPERTPVPARIAASSADDTLPRAVALAHLPRLLARLAHLPRSERGLFSGYLLPALSALPERQGALLRAQAADALAPVAAAAQVLSERVIASALDEGAMCSKPAICWQVNALGQAGCLALAFRLLAASVQPASY